MLTAAAGPTATGGTGRGAEVCVLAGMAGVGKTHLAVHAGRMLVDEGHFDTTLVVDLRGYHPDPEQPPAEPGAVLDGFLRLLGMSGHEIPYGLAERAAAFSERLAGDVRSSCSTTRPVPSRCGRCCPGRPARSPWSPRGVGSPTWPRRYSSTSTCSHRRRRSGCSSGRTPTWRWAAIRRRTSGSHCAAGTCRWH